MVFKIGPSDQKHRWPDRTIIFRFDVHAWLYHILMHLNYLSALSNVCKFLQDPFTNSAHYLFNHKILNDCLFWRRWVKRGVVDHVGSIPNLNFRISIKLHQIMSHNLLPILWGSHELRPMCHPWNSRKCLWWESNTRMDALLLLPPIRVHPKHVSIQLYLYKQSN